MRIASLTAHVWSVPNAALGEFYGTLLTQTTAVSIVGYGTFTANGNDAEALAGCRLGTSGTEASRRADPRRHCETMTHHP